MNIQKLTDTNISTKTVDIVNILTEGVYTKTIEHEKVTIKNKKKKSKNKKPRCYFEGCRTKLSLVEQSKPCRCKNVFCRKHFHIEEHKCTFDYKAFCHENFEKKAGLGGGKFAKLVKI